MLSLVGLLSPPSGVAALRPASAGQVIPLESQPFEPQLQETAARWRDAPLGEVVEASPRDTLLNFYVLMAAVGREIRAIDALAPQDPGLRWSEPIRRRIARLDQKFALAVKALDASSFPASIRDDMADEAAMQLKQVLDYVFNNSHQAVEIPDAQELRELNRRRNKNSDAWTYPETGITLTSEVNGNPTGMSYLFSADTVARVGKMYRQVSGLPVGDHPFVTPGLYRYYSRTPGYLVPPKWYLRLPQPLQNLLEIQIGEQTLFQISVGLISLLVYACLLTILLFRLLKTYRYSQATVRSGSGDSESLQLARPDHAPASSIDSRPETIAWMRVLLVLPALPLTWLSDKIIGDLVNFTGPTLSVFTYLFFILYFLAASLVSFYLFEALGRSLSHWLALLRGGGGDLQRRRISNLVMPICRVLGGLVALALIYWLLLLLGLPTATVLAFSAVPGLAIGLGASKLLGNLFAGLSIQTDRPVRVGEFCSIGGSQGFVTRIGLRSLELQTLASSVTIPNAIADEETIVNHCRRQADRDAPLLQSLEIRLPLPRQFSSDQITELMQRMRQFVAGHPHLQDPLLTVEQTGNPEALMVFSCLVNAHQWAPYLEQREAVMRRFVELCEQIRLCSRSIGVSYGTPVAQLHRIPGLIAEIVHADQELHLKSCRLMELSEYSYDFSIRLSANHATHAAVKDAINRFNLALIDCFEKHGIEIPFPTAIHQIRSGS